MRYPPVHTGLQMPDKVDNTFDPSTMPFVAPCRSLSPLAAIRWIRLGIADYRRAPRQSFTYGIAMAVIMAVLSFGAWLYGSIWFMLAMLGGFVFLAPLACIGLYAIAAQLERGHEPSIARSLRAAFRRHIGNEMVFAIILLVIFLVWARAGAMVSVFFPTDANPDINELRGYLAVGTLVGAVFAAVTFSASAFSLPMLMHRNVDSVTAIVTSINAVLRNKFAMMFWLAVIVVGLIIGTATLFAGMVFILPVIGYAAWHGYQEAIDASEFPRHTVGITAEPRAAPVESTTDAESLDA